MADKEKFKENTMEIDSVQDAMKVNSIDEILPYVGEFGRYQIMLVSMLSIIILCCGFPILIMYFAGQNPAWKCVYNSTVCNLNGTFASGDDNYEFRCSIPRKDWQFTQPKDYSIVTQFDIYCDTEYMIYLSTSLLFIGWGIGSFIFGWFADKYGRSKSLKVSVTGILLVGFLSAFAPNYAVFAVCRFVIGVFKPGTIIAAYIVSLELVGPRYRPLIGTLLWLLFSGSLILTGIKAYFIRKWKILIIACSAPYMLVFVFFFFIPESMRWLRFQGRHKEVIDILKKAAKINKKTLPAELELEPLPKADVDEKKHGILDLFRPLKMFHFSAVQGVAWCANAAVYYGVSLGVSDLSGEMYRDFILAMLIEIPALLLSVLCMNRIGRKKSVVVSLTLAGIFCCIVGGMMSADNKQKKWKALTVTAGLLGKFWITWSFNSIYVWSLELYPTSIRGEGMGFLQITARVGSALAPWIAKWLRVFHVMLPFSLMGALSLLSSVLLLVLAETKDRETLETVNQLFKLDSENNKDILVLKESATTDT
ncbi:organic cation transporter protein-like [Rhopilema esculentum]|uniref:organic cation transporter protein-like n=1 Tax=Rhopilema esculentum TaxID=499914 RepID=UPI0031DD84EA